MSEQTSEVAALEIVRTINAPRDRVFAAWTQADQVKKWFGPGTCRVDEAQIDFKVGGRYSFKMNDTDHGDVEVAGIYKEIVDAEKLVFSWQWQTEPLSETGVSEVTVAFVDRGDQTEVRLTHVGLISEEYAADHDKGWNGCFDCLQELVG